MVAPDRRPASSTTSVTSEPISRTNGRPWASTATRPAPQRTVGSARCNACAGSLPDDAGRSRHRSPVCCSIPSKTSRPAPQGSASTSRTSSPSRAAALATAAANTEAPAPPHAPSTAMHRPSADPPATASDSSPMSSSSDRSSSTVRSTPSRTHCSHSSAWGSPAATTTTPGRRASRAATALRTKVASSRMIGADRHSVRSSGSALWVTSTAAAAATRSRSSRTSWSSVMIKGRSSIARPSLRRGPRRGPPAASAPCGRPGRKNQGVPVDENRTWGQLTRWRPHAWRSNHISGRRPTTKPKWASENLGAAPARGEGGGRGVQLRGVELNQVVGSGGVETDKFTVDPWSRIRHLKTR